METIYIPAKVRSRVNEKKILEISKKLPKNIALAYSIQYKDIAINIRDILSKDKKITKFIQVLGCSKPRFSKDTQVVLLIGSGRFHAVSLGLETKLPIYILEKNRVTKVSKEDINKLEKRRKAAYVRFLNAKKVGVLVSTKPGQENLKRALDLREKLKKENYVFLTNNINTTEFENFSDIESWINTACPRLDMDSTKVINISDLK